MMKRLNLTFTILLIVKLSNSLQLNLVALHFFILDSYRPDDALLFELDSISRMLKLTTQLDRESIDRHEIRIVATNRKYGPENAKEPSMLIVDIAVGINYLLVREKLKQTIFFF